MAVSSTTSVLMTPTAPAAEVTTQPAEVLSEASADKIKSAWGDVCRFVKEVNGPLATLLKNSPLLQVQSGAATVGVRYLFHKEQLESAKSRVIIAEAAVKACGSRIRIVAEFTPQEEQALPVTEVLGDALKIFGGELVE